LSPADTRNSRTVGEDETLIWSAGHVHPGGLHTSLYDTRDGQKVELFRSKAEYYDPAGPVSWDMSMTATPPDYRVGLRKGDKLTVEATYDDHIASWYESMGIEFGWVAPAAPTDPFGKNRPLSTPLGPDPFTTPPDINGDVTHGHLPENGNHAGPAGKITAKTGQSTSRVDIADFLYNPGDLTTISMTGLPTVKLGTNLTFTNEDGLMIYHTVTSCAFPCLGPTGTSFPLSNGETSAGRKLDFDSAEVGIGTPAIGPAKQDLTYSLPVTEKAGFRPGEVVTYFCRIHPSMRGAFEVVQ
jgi:plastocyanin